MRFYHFTRREYVPSILKNGLIPQVGSNSSACAESDAYTYICSWDDAKYWCWLLDRDVLLEFEYYGGFPATVYSYGDYSEFIVDRPLRAKFREVVPPYDVHALSVLQQRYMETLSYLVLKGVRMFDNFKGIDAELSKWMHEVFAVVQIVPELKYSDMLPTSLASMITDYSDSGEYSFFDSYNNTLEKLYHRLKFGYEEPVTKIARSLLYNVIVSEFSKAEDLCHCGGYTI